MHSRREVLRGISAGVAAAVLPAVSSAETDEIDDCSLNAEKLAASMKAQYGGDWAVNIKPEYGFVVIVKS